MLSSGNTTKQGLATIERTHPMYKEIPAISVAQLISAFKTSVIGVGDGGIVLPNKFLQAMTIFSRNYKTFDINPNLGSFSDGSSTTHRFATFEDTNMLVSGYVVTYKDSPQQMAVLEFTTKVSDGLQPITITVMNILGHAYSYVIYGSSSRKSVSTSAELLNNWVFANSRVHFKNKRVVKSISNILKSLDKLDIPIQSNIPTMPGTAETSRLVRRSIFNRW